jgi:hypothetical protein
MNYPEEENQSHESLKSPKDGDHEFQSGHQFSRHFRGIDVRRHPKLLMERKVKGPGLIPG